MNVNHVMSNFNVFVEYVVRVMIPSQLIRHSTVELKGNGATQASVDERARKTKLYNWAALNLESGMPWDRQTFEAKLGPSTKGPSTLSRNHDAYYFADPDITLLVNRVTNEMTVWRKGDVAN